MQKKKKHQSLTIWAILSLFRLQRMLKLGNTLSGKDALDNLYLVLQKDKKIRVLIHIENSLKRLGI